MAEDETQSVTPMRAAVAEEIRALLARRRISASELARRMDVTQPYISRRLTGDTALDLDDLERIANVLGVQVLDLFPDEPVASPAVSAEPRVVARAGRKQRRGAAAEPNVL